MESKEVLKALGLPEDLDSVEKVVDAHRSSYLLKNEAHEDETVKGKITGKLFGELTTEAKRAFGLETAEIKDMHIKDILKLGVEKQNTKIKELEETAGKGSEEVIGKLKTEAEKYKGQANQYKTDLEKVVGEKAELETQFTGKLKQHKIDTVYKDAMAKLPLSESVTEVSKIGFDTLIKGNFKFDIGENDEFLVLDAQGQKVPNPTKTGVYLGLSEVLEMEAKKQNMLKQNNLPTGRQTPTYTPPAGQPATRTREIHPSARRTE